ncbi:O-antigen ligase family protein [Marinobacter sp. TBZ242]|uniref:O-antigen ligase family protein n=1 Tax=Marinobacter azerbaijanicus TaxID=3050455 RepID=A0ABT7IJP0_9GAMM|nr:O-antigen ligase family protein [Marinobacter sp. TBZ242]MDL0433334.1 O-antigen ligase family protein [Marinobacter sp. TBZ242]
MNQPTRMFPVVLIMVGLGGALLSSSILAIATLLLAISGLVFIYKKTLQKAGWDTPKELRLLHFAFWFFVLVSSLSWALEGFDYEGGKTFGTHARFILFWPLVVALTAVGFRARHFFLATALVALSSLVALLIALATEYESFEQLLTTRFGAGINPISFGNLALLGGVLALVGGSYFARTGKTPAAIAVLGLGATAIVISMLSGTRSNLIALPVLLILLLPLVGPKLRLPGLAAVAVISLALLFSSDRMHQSIEDALEGKVLEPGIEIRLELWQVTANIFMEHPWTGVGLGGYSSAIENLADSHPEYTRLKNCCTGHAHNDLLNNAATSGIPGILSWGFLIFIPMVIFAKNVFNSHKPSAHIAVAGTMVSAGYLVFGLTEATFNRSLFLTFYLLAIAGLASALLAELSASYFRQRKVKVSATIIAKDEEHHIADCLKSARLVADEIIVLDSGSSDRTAEIAKEYADVVEVTDWPGFGVQKQRALEKATGEWVLSLDADERITPELAKEINHHLAEPDADAYKLPWAVTIYGKRLDFGRSGRAPLRLFRREGVSFSDALVHERILIPEGRKTRTLRGRLTHYTHRDFGHSLEKSAKYAWLGAMEKHRRGKKTRTMLYPTLRGVMTFVQVYFIRFGFLDGAVGYLTAVTYSQVTFNKYAGLWTLGRTSIDQPLGKDED